MKMLARQKHRTIADEEDFLETAEENFTAYYQSLIPWMNRLRKVVFSGGARWKKQDQTLYSLMKEMLHAAQQDLKMLAE